MGLLLHRQSQGNKIHFSASNVVETFAPDHFKLLFKQRTKSWDLATHRKFPSILRELVCRWKNQFLLLKVLQLCLCSLAAYNLPTQLTSHSGQHTLQPLTHILQPLTLQPHTPPTASRTRYSLSRTYSLSFSVVSSFWSLPLAIWPTVRPIEGSSSCVAGLSLWRSYCSDSRLATSIFIRVAATHRPCLPGGDCRFLLYACLRPTDPLPFCGAS